MVLQLIKRFVCRNLFFLENELAAKLHACCVMYQSMFSIDSDVNIVIVNWFCYFNFLSFQAVENVYFTVLRLILGECSSTCSRCHS